MMPDHHEKSAPRREASLLAMAALLLFATAAVAATGGPDLYGYTWKDGAEPGVAYAWEDISATGTDITGAGGDDANFGFQPLSFTFPYYGSGYNQVAACSNGWMSLVDDVSSAYQNGLLPSAAEPRGAIAPFWDDLAVTQGVTRMLFADLGTRAVITWENVHDYQDISRQDTFQVILMSDGRIFVQIKSINSTPTIATLGIESPDDADGLTVYADSPAGVPTSNYVVEFDPPATIPNRLACGSVQVLACGDAVSADRSAGAANQSLYSCGTADYSGAEQIYQLDFVVPTSVHVELTTGGGAADLIMLSACDPNRCLAPPNDALDFVGLTGTFFVVVDGAAGQEGPYELRVRCVDCPNATPIACSDVVVGDLANGQPGAEVYGCGSGYTGNEIAYRIDATVPLDLLITLTELSGDPDLLILDGCDPSRCQLLTGGTINLTGVIGTRYLVLDCPAGREGQYRLEVQCLADDFPFCGGASTLRGDPWANGDGAFVVDSVIYPDSDTGSFALRVDGTTTYANRGADCPLLRVVRHRALLPTGPASVEWDCPEGDVTLDMLEQQVDACCGLLVRISVTNTDTVSHSYDFRAYHDTAFGLGTGVCTTGTIDGGPIEVAGTRYTTEQDVLALMGDTCLGQLRMFGAEDPATLQTTFEMLPPNSPEIFSVVKWDDGTLPCSRWVANVNGEPIDACAQDNSVLLAWRFPAGAGTLAPGETATASYRIGLGCAWGCNSVCEDPVLGTGSVVDPRPCSAGLYLSWDRAAFPAGGNGVYHVYRSGTSFADALLQAPLTGALGTRQSALVDTTSVAGVQYYYVVLAESTDMPLCGTGPLVQGSTDELDLGPIEDQQDAGGPPAGVGGALRVAPRGADQLDLSWPLAPAPGPGEYYVVTRSDDRAEGPFDTRALPLVPAWTDPSAPPRFDPVHVWFYDVRLADDCGNWSQD